jgi:hypothetical protein
MSRGKWRYPTPAEIKRAIKANLELGLAVTGVRVDEHGVTVSTSLDPPPQPTDNRNEWDA